MAQRLVLVCSTVRGVQGEYLRSRTMGGGKDYKGKLGRQPPSCPFGRDGSRSWAAWVAGAGRRADVAGKRETGDLPCTRPRGVPADATQGGPSAKSRRWGERCREGNWGGASAPVSLRLFAIDALMCTNCILCLYCTICFITFRIMMKHAKPKRSKDASKLKCVVETKAADSQTDVPEPEAFLEQAKAEPRRKLILDHTETIRMLRTKKNFTFSAIADWFCERGFQTDRSAVYRAYLLSIPKEQIDPDDKKLLQMEPD